MHIGKLNETRSFWSSLSTSKYWFKLRSFIKISQGNGEDDDVDKYMEGGKVSYDQFGGKGNGGSGRKRRDQSDSPY